MTLLSSQDRRAAICLRLSDDPHKGTSREGEGIARQGEDCDDHAEYNRWPVVHRLVDNDKSAMRRRPGFEKLLKLIAAGEINVVIAWSSVPPRVRWRHRNLEEHQRCPHRRSTPTSCVSV
ncbi:recombinase family protein, partial [Micromonospora sp. NPDC050980]|uniref:recombinase family protein n=1 Tax=Micromonospora sp. NPDC050980 TaxID=3155161 RepID=UPI0033F7886B